MTIRDRYAKIVATLGPSSSDEKTIKNLFKAGVDIFRMNFSHGSHEDHAERIAMVRRIEQETGRPIGILADMQGPKLRVGTFENEKETLKKGQKFELHLANVAGDKTKVQLPHKEIFAVTKKGDELLVNDGRLRLAVLSNKNGVITTKVGNNAVISDRKGVNVPGAVLPIDVLTKKDRKDLEFALQIGVEWIAMSFVQTANDVIKARKLIKGRARILSKLEKPSSIENLAAIVDASDAVMVARGDLGVEMPPENVPQLQKQIIAKCRNDGKPVIVATQMLESMIDEPVATRAEASDVANAIYAGADAVMLSAETAAGKYPIEAVKVMNRIIKATESDPDFDNIIHAVPLPIAANDSDSIASAACDVARTRGCAAIAIFTKTGSTARRVSRLRTLVPILGLTPEIEVARQMSLAWGVHAIQTRDDIEGFNDMVGKSTRIARREKLAKNKDRIVLTAGVPFGEEGSTNILRVAVVGKHEAPSK
ncbi:MAG: pyruvate kinase [Nitratireductor sp.]